MKMTLMIIGGILFVLFTFLGWASYPWTLSHRKVHPGIENVEPEVMVTGEENPAVVKVLTWNLGFLFGEGSEGPGYSAKGTDFYQSKLDELVTLVNDSQPDVICFQEIDLGSARSQGINQAKYVAMKLSLIHI